MPPATRHKQPKAEGARISWKQATTFRLRRQHLSERARTAGLVSVVADMAGAQAQVYSAAQTSLWARVRDLEQQDVERAIWRDRNLARAWCMRRTLYLLPAKDLAIFVRGSARRAEKEIRWMRGKGVSGATLEGVLEAVLMALDQPLTRGELAERLGESLGLAIRWRRGGGWGSQRTIPCIPVGGVTCPVYYLLHLAGARGVLCSGPSRGTEATFVRADAWLPGWHDARVDQAEEELLRRYLRTFGPASAADFMAWTRMRLSDARAVWTRVEEELAPVDLEGRPAWVLRSDLPDLEDSVDDRPTVRLLPYFDSFLLGHMERGHLVETSHLRRVYRNQGWVAPVVLVQGRVKGVWSHERKGDRLRVRVEPFGSVSPALSSAIHAESRDLARFLGCQGVDLRLGRTNPASRSGT